MTWGEPERLTDSLLSDPLFVYGVLLVLVFLTIRFLLGRRRSGTTKHAFTLKAPQLRLKWKRKWKRKPERR